MTCSLLHLNDFHVQLFNAQGELLATPAQLVFDQGTLISGEAATACARIKPLQAYNQHWQQLNQTPVKLPDNRYRHHADLAYRQLEQWLAGFDTEAPLVVAPSYRYQQDQYALLAGMLQALGAKPAGFVHNALLHCQGFLHDAGAVNEPLIHVDICLHQAHITQLHQRDGQLVITQEWDIPQCGMATLAEGWLKQTARACIQQTRYNPLHSAESEQRLFNQWLPCMASLAQSPSIELIIDDKTIELKRAHFEPLWAALSEHLASRPGLCLLSPAAQRLPGLTGSALTDAQMLSALAALAPRVSGPLQLLRSLPLPTTASQQPDTERKPVAEATHLLINGVARPLSDALRWRAKGAALIASDSTAVDLELYRANGQWFCRTTLPCELNGQPAGNNFPLAIGQQVTWQNCHMQLVQVVPHGA